MKITVIGTGYVGLVTGVCFANYGNDVICVDIDNEKIQRLKDGKTTFYEPGLEEMLIRNLESGRLEITSNTKKGVEESDILFVCVGTPQTDNGEADLSYIEEAAASIGKHLNDHKIIVLKSTVPVGTNKKVEKIIERNSKKGSSYKVVSNPEFLREGSAVKDFQNPDRIVIGIDDKETQDIMNKLYRSMIQNDRTIIFTNPETAEIIKYASNAMLAARISFINQLSHLCDKVGADVHLVARGMGLDKRIGTSFLKAGVGYGGSCFPKDVKALARTLEEHELDSTLIRAIDLVNEYQKKSLIPKLKEHHDDLSNKKIAIWGLSFKPNTSDIRESPAITVIKQLLAEGANIVAFDPKASKEMEKMFPNIEYAKNMYSCLDNADALIVCTDWNDFKEPDFKKIKEMMNSPIVIDGRNLYNPEEMSKMGFNYRGVGRKQK